MAWREVTRADEARGPAGAATISALKALPAGYQSGEVFVQGYYAANDGGGGLFRWNSSSTSTDNGGTVIIPNSAPSSGRWDRVLPNPAVYRPEYFGAKGDGTTDDTSAIQEALDAATSAAATAIFAARSYRISSSLTVNVTSPPSLLNQTGFAITADSRADIVQATTNTPVLAISGSDTNYFAIEGITFTYATQQSTSNTSAVCLLFDTAGGGAYNFTIKRCRFLNGYRGIQQTQSVTRIIWGAWISECDFKNLAGAAIYHHSAVAAGSPSVSLKNVYVHAQRNTTEDNMTFYYCHTLHLDGVEFNYVNRTAVFTDSCNSVALTSCRAESGTYPTVGTALFRFSNTDAVTVQNLECYNVTFSATTGAQYLVESLLFNRKISLKNIWFQPASVGVGGSAYIFSGNDTLANSPAEVELSGLSAVSPANGDFPPSQPWVTSRLRFYSAEQRRAQVSADRGNASATLAITDETTQRFNTTLTANRTVTLPTNATSFNGARFRVVRLSGATGAFTLIVQDATPTTLHTFASSITNVWADFEYTGSAWMKTASGSV